MKKPQANPDKISVLGLGCSRVGSFNNTAPMSQVRATLEMALDLGVTVFDTADIYGQGDSEREIGRALRGRREEAFVVTKLGKTFSAKMRLLRPLKPLLKPLLRAGKARERVVARRGDNMAEDFTPARFPEAVEASLKRLGFEHLDGLMLHSPPAAVAADPEVGEALAALQRAGKVVRFGVSCDDRACLDAALTMPGMTLLQLPLDLIEAIRPEGLMDGFAARGITVFAREVIRLRPDLTPPAAVAAAAAIPGIDCILAGASHPERLSHLAGAARTGLLNRPSQG